MLTVIRDSNCWRLVECWRFSTQADIDGRDGQPLVFEEDLTINSALEFSGDLAIEIKGGTFEMLSGASLSQADDSDALAVTVTNHIPDEADERSIYVAPGAQVNSNGEVRLTATSGLGAGRHHAIVEFSGAAKGFSDLALNAYVDISGAESQPGEHRHRANSIALVGAAADLTVGTLALDARSTGTYQVDASTGDAAVMGTHRTHAVIRGDVTSPGQVSAHATDDSIIDVAGNYDASANVDLSTRAFVGDGVEIASLFLDLLTTVRNSVYVDVVATGDNQDRGFAGQATMHGDIEAMIGDGAVINSVQGTFVEATSSPFVDAVVSADPQSTVGGDGLKASASVSGEVKAHVGDGARIRTSFLDIFADGLEDVSASTTVARGARLMGAATADSAATVDNTVLANFGVSESPTGQARVSAADVRLVATSDPLVATNTLVETGADVIGGRAASATTTVTPSAHAFIGESAVVTVNQLFGASPDEIFFGEVNVEALSAAEGDAVVRVFGGPQHSGNGGVEGVAVVSPHLNAYIASGASLTADRNVVVNAELTASESPSEASDRAPITAIDTVADSITADIDLRAGDQVLYQADLPINGLEVGREYQVLTDSNLPAGQFRFGAEFNGTSIDEDRDTISFDGPHGLRTGDRVKYRRFQGAGVRGLDTATPYYVRVIDDFTIKLGKSLAQVRAFPHQFGVDQITGNRLQIPSHGFQNGDLVSYHAPLPLVYTTNAVNQLGNSVIGAQGQSHGLVSGDPVIYTVDHDSDGDGSTDDNNDGIPDGRITARDVSGRVVGLTSGMRLYVQVVDEFRFQLSETPDGSPLVLQPADPNDPANANIEHRFSRGGPIGGLVDGVTYVVRGAAQDAFALETMSGDLVQLDTAGTSLAATHEIGIEGMNLYASTGFHELHFDLEGRLLGNHSIAGQGGGPLSDVALGDGVSGVSARGAGKDQLTQGAITAAPIVKAYVEAAQHGRTAINAGGDVIVSTAAFVNAENAAQNRGGGTVKSANVEAATHVHPVSLAFLGTEDIAGLDGSGILISARDVAVTGIVDHSTDVSAQAVGGGAVGQANAQGTTDVLFVSKAMIGDGASITAIDGIVAAADSRTNADSASRASVSGGFAQGAANANASSVFPPGISIHGDTHVEVGGGATLTGRTVQLGAQVLHLDASNRSAATSFLDGLHASSRALARSVVDVDSNAKVIIEGEGTRITGHEGVDISARHDDEVNISRRAGRLGSGGNPTQTATVDGAEVYRSQVQAAPGATIVAGARGNVLQQRRSTEDLALLVEATNFTLDRADEPNRISDGADGLPLDDDRSTFTESTLIHWDADVELLAGGAADPLLIVNEAGQIDVARNISARVPTRRTDRQAVIVQDIRNEGTHGQILFEGDGALRGTEATFAYRDTLDSITIINRSELDLVLNDIDVLIENTGDALHDVIIDVPDAGPSGTEFQFDVVRTAEPTSIDISSTNSFSDLPHTIFVNDVINNPIGTTKISNARGSIVTRPVTGVVRTNVLDVDAPDGSIGALRGQRFAVELVQSAKRPTGLSADASFDIEMDVRGLLRDPDAHQLIVEIDHVDAGQNADLRLLKGIRQTDAEASPIVIEVFETERVVEPPSSPTANPDFPPRTTRVTAHFRPQSLSTAELPIGVFGYGDRHIRATYELENLEAGDNIDLNGVFDPGSPRIHVTANTNTVEGGARDGMGNIDARTNGNIHLTETQGDLRVGLIVSTLSDVSLTSQRGSIIEAPDVSGQPDPIGNNITLNAPFGRIGSFNAPVHIDSGHSGPGVLTAHARQNIFVTETVGDLHVGEVVSEMGDVELRALNGQVIGGPTEPDAPVDPPAAEARLQTGMIKGIATNRWTTVTLDYHYDAMVVVATPVYDNDSVPHGDPNSTCIGQYF